MNIKSGISFTTKTRNLKKISTPDSGPYEVHQVFFKPKNKYHKRSSSSMSEHKASSPLYGVVVSFNTIKKLMDP